MIMMGTQFLDKEPFKNIYVHALVRDEKGQKMSKSKGNVIDPLELIEKYVDIVFCNESEIKTCLKKGFVVENDNKE